MTDPTTLPDLLPCPFCGHPDWDHRHAVIPGDTKDGMSFGCMNCFAQGPFVEPCDEAKAAEAWNRRAPPAAPTGWRDIATAPKDGNSIWCYVAGYQTSLTWINGAWRNLSAWGRLEEWSPTHWMPLPAAPSPTTGPAAAAEESPSGGKPKIS